MSAPEFNGQKAIVRTTSPRAQPAAIRLPARAPAGPTERQKARERRKAERAAKGHAELAAQHRKAADGEKDKDARASRVAMALEHDRAAARILGQPEPAAPSPAPAPEAAPATSPAATAKTTP